MNQQRVPKYILPLYQDQIHELRISLSDLEPRSGNYHMEELAKAEADLKKLQDMSEQEITTLNQDTYDKRPGAITVDQKDLLRRFKEKYAELMGENAAFLGDLREDLDQIASCELDSYSFPLPLWVKAVYLAIDAFSGSEDLKILDVLRVLWQGRFLSLVRETEGMSAEEAEAYIRGQLAVFEEQRSILSS